MDEQERVQLLEAIKDRLSRILSLSVTPHWDPGRKARIAELADEALTLLVKLENK